MIDNKMISNKNTGAGRGIGWMSQFFKTVPVLDDSGNPIAGTPALNTRGFWVKPDHKRFDRPRDTADGEVAPSLDADAPNTKDSKRR